MVLLKVFEYRFKHEVYETKMVLRRKLRHTGGLIGLLKDSRFKSLLFSQKISEAFWNSISLRFWEPDSCFFI